MERSSASALMAEIRVYSRLDYRRKTVQKGKLLLQILNFLPHIAKNRSIPGTLKVLGYEPSVEASIDIKQPHYNGTFGVSYSKTYQI